MYFHQTTIDKQVIYLICCLCWGCDVTASFSLSSGVITFLKKYDHHGFVNTRQGSVPLNIYQEKSVMKTL